jgi:hypothetical protein
MTMINLTSPALPAAINSTVTFSADQKVKNALHSSLVMMAFTRECSQGDISRIADFLSKQIAQKMTGTQDPDPRSIPALLNVFFDPRNLQRLLESAKSN